jgi:hypothetical protein
MGFFVVSMIMLFTTAYRKQNMEFKEHLKRYLFQAAGALLFCLIDLKGTYDYFMDIRNQKIPEHPFESKQYLINQIL